MYFTSWISLSILMEDLLSVSILSPLAHYILLCHQDLQDVSGRRFLLSLFLAKTFQSAFHLEDIFVSQLTAKQITAATYSGLMHQEKQRTSLDQAQ